MGRNKNKPSGGVGKFESSPFKNLKGVAVAATEPAAAVKKTPPAPVAKKPEEDSALFQREMDLLGVRERFDGKESDRPPHLTVEVEDNPPAEELDDEALFLASMGQMDNLFCDEIPLPEEGAATPRRMRQLRQGRRSPEARLDLHGMTRLEARDKVRFFLEDAVFAGKKTVLIITGRGKGSAQGPVLRQFMESYLSREAKAWVVEWGRAPARYGGEGALVAFLRGPRSSR